MTIDSPEFVLPHLSFVDAQLHASQARRAARHREQQGVPTALERQLAGLCVTQCAQATIEWARWAFVTARMPLPGWTESTRRHRLVVPWRQLGWVARALGRPAVGISDLHATFLNDLDAWQQLIDYNSDEAEEYLRGRLIAVHLIDGRHCVTRALGADLATTVVAHTGQLFDWAASATGLTAPPKINPARHSHLGAGQHDAARADRGAATLMRAISA